MACCGLMVCEVVDGLCVEDGILLNVMSELRWMLKKSLFFFFVVADFGIYVYGLRKIVGLFLILDHCF
jgi:hypothetical protein